MPVAPRIYNLFPLLAGPIRNWAALLPNITAMGFDWVYLNPWHYPGFSGSLYAVKDYDRVHPRLADDTQDPKIALKHFLQQAREYGLRVMMDLVINHTSKDALLAHQHPEFYLRDDSGELVSPSAIDPADARKVTVWGDLAELDYRPRTERSALLGIWKDLLRNSIDLGFSGFRCDAAYQVPADVWAELIDYGRKNSHVLFVAETLGGRLEPMKQLASAGFDAFFNSSKWWDFRQPWLLEQYECFRHLAPSIAFPESHDTPRLIADLAEQSITDPWRIEAHYRLRYLFAAFFSAGVMMPMGFETGQGKRLDVVRTVPEDLESPRFDLAPFLAAANHLKRDLPVLGEEGPQRLVTASQSPIVGLLRSRDHGSGRCLALINPSCTESHSLSADSLLAQVGQGWRIVCDSNLGAVEGELKPGATVRLHPLAMRVLHSES
ncbi:MAG: Alpha-1,4-glucan:maltose-1-phosphate maltosyltransferase 1 [Deltaproteobacteria bacterium ADurb.Bin207]|nr:MAG: Alpha-1,4-glucan:maltose-1-phosphate maltosyltransferase 1 [Deltaproteobacteria bacterium ADurb.Bin207]